MTDPAHYEHSGEFSPLLVLPGAAVAALAGLLLAWVYAYGIFYIPFIYINVILTAGFGALLALVSVWTLRRAKVRNTGIFALATLAVAAVAFYGHWAAWLGILLRKSGIDVMGLDVAAQPRAMWGAILDVNAVGAWSLFGANVSGVPLWGIWALEAAIVFGLATFVALGMFDDVPFCERCETWCKKHANVARVWGDDPEAAIDALRKKDFDALRTLRAVPLDAQEGTWLECDVELCPDCGATNTLDVSVVVATKNDKGEAHKDTKPALSNLLISAEEAAAIRSLASAAP